MLRRANLVGRAKAMTLALALIVIPANRATASNPRVIADPEDDTVIRRTDSGNDGPVDPMLHHLPDLTTIRIGRFTPMVPHADRFDGDWQTSGAYMRIDLEFKGLINPPGPVGWDSRDPSYDPCKYGPNPVFGYVEFDIDADADTGGELDYPQYRYLGQVGRFGGYPQGPEFVDRVAIDHGAFDHLVQSPPYCDRSGEEFHLVLRGEETDEVEVVHEKPGGDEDTFETGETWVMSGDFFHRAHGFEEFAFQCADRPGRYKPEVELQFRHDVSSDRTIVSLVYPLTNAASAALRCPGTSTQANDGCENNQNSITEALTDLVFSAVNASPQDLADPEFQLLATWAGKSPDSFQDPTLWRLTCLVGTAYDVQQSGSARNVWTDIWPNVDPGDFNGDAMVDQADETLLNEYVDLTDGDTFYDTDPTPDGVVQCNGFAYYFMLYDVNYDGIVDANDLNGIVIGDMDIDGDVDVDDIDDFVLALLDSAAYSASHGGEDPLPRGDFNSDGALDGLDIEPLIAALAALPP